MTKTIFGDCEIYGTGLKSGFINITPREFVVKINSETTTKKLKKLIVKIENLDNPHLFIDIKICSDKNNPLKYIIKYQTLKPGKYAVSILINNIKINKSPIMFTLNYPKVAISGSGIEDGYINESLIIKIDDKLINKIIRLSENFKAIIKDPSLNILKYKIKIVKDKYIITFTPVTVGRYQIKLFLCDSLLKGNVYLPLFLGRKVIINRNKLNTIGNEKKRKKEKNKIFKSNIKYKYPMEKYVKFVEEYKENSISGKNDNEIIKEYININETIYNFIKFFEPEFDRKKEFVDGRMNDGILLYDYINGKITEAFILLSTLYKHKLYYSSYKNKNQIWKFDLITSLIKEGKKRLLKKSKTLSINNHTDKSYQIKYGKLNIIELYDYVNEKANIIYSKLITLSPSYSKTYFTMGKKFWRTKKLIKYFRQEATTIIEDLSKAFLNTDFSYLMESFNKTLEIKDIIKVNQEKGKEMFDQLIQYEKIELLEVRNEMNHIYDIKGIYDRLTKHNEKTFYAIFSLNPFVLTSSYKKGEVWDTNKLIYDSQKLMREQLNLLRVDLNDCAIQNKLFNGESFIIIDKFVELRDEICKKIINNMKPTIPNTKEMIYFYNLNSDYDIKAILKINKKTGTILFQKLKNLDKTQNEQKFISDTGIWDCKKLHNLILSKTKISVGKTSTNNKMNNTIEKIKLCSNEIYSNPSIKVIKEEKQISKIESTSKNLSLKIKIKENKKDLLIKKEVIKEINSSTERFNKKESIQQKTKISNPSKLNRNISSKNKEIIREYLTKAIYKNLRNLPINRGRKQENLSINKTKMNHNDKKEDVKPSKLEINHIDKMRIKSKTNIGIKEETKRIVRNKSKLKESIIDIKDDKRILSRRKLNEKEGNNKKEKKNFIKLNIKNCSLKKLVNGRKCFSTSINQYNTNNDKISSMRTMKTITNYDKISSMRTMKTINIYKSLPKARDKNANLRDQIKLLTRQKTIHLLSTRKKEKNLYQVIVTNSEKDKAIYDIEKNQNKYTKIKFLNIVEKEYWKRLARSLKNNTTITNIEFIRTRLYNQGVKLVCNALANMKNLSGFSLIEDYSVFTDGWKSMSRMMQKSNNLKIMKVWVPSHSFESAIVELSKGIQNSNTITEFRLIYNRKVNEKKIEHIRKVLKENENVKEFLLPETIKV